MAAPASHATGHDDHGHGDHDDHGGTSVYVGVFIALCVLTAISFFVASSPMFAKTQLIRVGVMVSVSCAKALLVMLYFMHLKWEANWKYVLTIPASIMSAFLVLMLIPDVGLRRWWYSEERAYYASDAEDASHGHDDEGHDAGHDSPDHH